MSCVLARSDEAWDSLRECGIAGKPTPTWPVDPAHPAAVNAASRAAAGPGTAHRRRTLRTGVIRPSTPPMPAIGGGHVHPAGAELGTDRRARQRSGSNSVTLRAGRVQT